VRVLGAGKAVPVVSVFEAKMIVDAALLAQGAQLVMHIGPHVEEVTIKRVVSVTSKGGEPRKARFAKAGDSVRVGISTNRPVALEKFEDHASLGRFVLRDGGMVVAVGQVMATARTAN
jgi:translation elongation factor EF-1alpha